MNKCIYYFDCQKKIVQKTPKYYTKWDSGYTVVYLRSDVTTVWPYISLVTVDKCNIAITLIATKISAKNAKFLSYYEILNILSFIKGVTSQRYERLYPWSQWWRHNCMNVYIPGYFGDVTMVWTSISLVTVDKCTYFDCHGMSWSSMSSAINYTKLTRTQNFIGENLVSFRNIL